MNIEAKLASKLTKLFPESEGRAEAISLLDSYGQKEKGTELFLFPCSAKSKSVLIISDLCFIVDEPIK